MLSVKNILFVFMLMFYSAFAISSTQIEISAAAGEFENRRHTERYTLEINQSITNNMYAVAYALKAHHPLPEIEDRVMAGLGYRWKDWDASMVGDDNRYLMRLMFIAPTEKWQIEGGVLHGNKWEEGFKQTGLRVSVAYPFHPNVSIGAFYEIGNTTMTAVDDLYGSYLRFRF